MSTKLTELSAWVTRSYTSTKADARVERLLWLVGTVPYRVNKRLLVVTALRAVQLAVVRLLVPSAASI